MKVWRRPWPGLLALLSACVPVQATGGASQAWRDDFDTLDTTRWTVSEGAPFWLRDGLRGSWAARQVRAAGGYLILRLDVSANLVAQAAELSTRAASGYGRYQARLRAASLSADPRLGGRGQSGSVSAFFNFVNDSETEIDHEIEGQRPSVTWAGAYQTTARHEDGAVNLGGDLAQGFHTYRWDWTPTRLDFYVDGVLKHRNTRVRPTAPAPLFFNLWPTNSTDWGGVSTPGTRYMLVDWVSYTPLGSDR